MATVNAVSIYCLPNIRAPWVLVYEPHPWGHGALRVKEESALLVYERAPTEFEIAWMAEKCTYMCRTFTTVEGLLDYEDGQHEHAADVREMIELKRDRVEAILALVKKKQDDKRRREAARRRPLKMANEPKGDDDGEEQDDEEAREEEAGGGQEARTQDEGGQEAGPSARQEPDAP